MPSLPNVQKENPSENKIRQPTNQAPSPMLQSLHRVRHHLDNSPKCIKSTHKRKPSQPGTWAQCRIPAPHVLAQSKNKKKKRCQRPGHIALSLHIFRRPANARPFNPLVWMSDFAPGPYRHDEVESDGSATKRMNLLVGLQRLPRKGAKFVAH